eukprot:CAMPEP_0201612030 /NCGR_PEP_ID=MMETSP0492-20130828/21909_1 /ASSEMBLY_ACC=CAM_ASM_000837 /TAXON_ID=420259 /ORGANISM="Thalassiosira gravida, Strain GMp14c1" /LENGTH=68 /DNA_ID=CAMNT_0048078413 /DNA_START=289 /DNA_END=495 /DNA_ORIENTATION=-
MVGSPCMSKKDSMICVCVNAMKRSSNYGSVNQKDGRSALKRDAMKQSSGCLAPSIIQLAVRSNANVRD